MACHVLTDAHHNQAVLFCSTSMWAFGPVFVDGGIHDAEERAEAFLRWLADFEGCTPAKWACYDKEPLDTGRRDPRILTESGLLAAVREWEAQEHAQWAREDAALFAEEN